MKNHLAILLILALPIILNCQKYTSGIDEKIKLVECSLNDITMQLIGHQTIESEMKKLKVPGVTVAVINDFALSWNKFYGVANTQTNENLSSEHVFEVASITKVFTSVVVLNLVEMGLIDLDADINQYLKRWKLSENEFTGNHKVTLRLLLSHQAGINRPASMYSFKEGSSPSLVDVLSGNLPAINDEAVVEFEPGSKWAYSNIAFNIIEMILEDVSEKSLTELFKEIIFEPLGMKNSFIGYPISENLQQRLSISHNQEAKAGGMSIHPSALAHGGLITSSEDLSKFMIELMLSYNGTSNKVLSKELVRLMFTKLLDLDPAAMGGFEVSQGLGVLIRGDLETDFSIMFAGSNGKGSTSIFYADPNTGQGGIIMTNGAMGELLQLEILDAIGNIYQWSEKNRFSIN
jgi:CubicO group peptidase (beta-lactamase class C family)